MLGRALLAGSWSWNFVYPTKNFWANATQAHSVPQWPSKDSHGHSIPSTGTIWSRRPYLPATLSCVRAKSSPRLKFPFQPFLHIGSVNWSHFRGTLEDFSHFLALSSSFFFPQGEHLNLALASKDPSANSLLGPTQPTCPEGSMSYPLGAVIKGTWETEAKGEWKRRGM